MDKYQTCRDMADDLDSIAVVSPARLANKKLPNPLISD